MKKTLDIFIIYRLMPFTNKKGKLQQTIKAKTISTDQVLYLTLFDDKISLLNSLGLNNSLRMEVAERKVFDKNNTESIYYNVTGIQPLLGMMN